MRKAPDTWRDRYKGLLLEAIHDGHHWCGYVYVPLDRPTNEKSESLWLAPKKPVEINGCTFGGTYPYSDVELIRGAPAHGGVTWHHKHLADGGKPPFPSELRAVCIGWDYAHMWDDERGYTLEDVMNNARQVADYFIEEIGIEVR